MDKDRIEGKLKEAEGKLTGDEEREKEGQAQDAWGKTKDKADDAWESTKDAAESAKESVDKRDLIAHRRPRAPVAPGARGSATAGARETLRARRPSRSRASGEARSRSRAHRR